MARPLAFFLLCSLPLTLSLTACWRNGDCGKSVEESVTPDEIHGDSKIYIGLDKLEFLFGKDGYVMEDVDLRADLNNGKTTTTVGDISLSLNGIKLSRKDGRPVCESLTPNPSEGFSESHFKLQKMALNGGMPFDQFLSNLRRNKGRLEITVGGLAAGIRRAKLVFKGHSAQCPDPNPNPQPKPAAKTKIDSATPSQPTTALTDMALAFSADQTGVTFWCALDGKVAAKCTSPQSYSHLANGSHKFQVYSVNASGKTETPAVEYDWTVDSLAPTVTISNASDLKTLTAQTSVNFIFASNEAATFQCNLDGSAFVACTSPQAYSALAEGPHTFAVRAIDAVGNVGGDPATFAWRIDQTAPVTTIVAVTPFEAISRVDHRTIEFSASESANFECSYDNGTFVPCESPVTMNGLSEGNHWFEVRATDLAGNLGLGVSVSWQNDYTPPVLLLGAVAPAPGLTNAKSVSVEFSLNESATVQCSKDQAAPEPCASPVQWTDLPDGQHHLQLIATDTAGNIGAPIQLDWTVDSTAPVLSFAAILPSAASYLNSNAVEFQINASESAQLQMTLNGAALAASNPLQLSGLSDGTYQLSVVAIDPAGNASAALTHDFVIDTQAPQLLIAATDPRDPTNQDRRSFVFTSDESVSYQCNADGAGFAACATPLQLSGLADGSHTLQVQAIDLSGNMTQGQAQWAVDTQAPVTTLSAVTQSTSADFTYSVSEPAQFECSFDGAAASACTSPSSFSGLTPGQHSFVVWAIDLAGNRDPAGASYSFLVLKPIVTTITAASPGTSPSNQNTASFSFTADQVASGFMCSLDGTQAVACTSPVNYTGLSDGTHTFLVKATDMWGNVDVKGASQVWVVDATPPAVTGMSTTATTNSITVTWTTSEPTTDQVRYGVGFTLNQQTPESTARSTTHSAQLSGLSSNTTYSLQVYGRDLAGNSYLSASRTVRTAR